MVLHSLKKHFRMLQMLWLSNLEFLWRRPELPVPGSEECEWALVHVTVSHWMVRKQLAQATNEGPMVNDFKPA